MAILFDVALWLKLAVVHWAWARDPSARDSCDIVRVREIQGVIAAEGASGDHHLMLSLGAQSSTVHALVVQVVVVARAKRSI